MVRFNLTDQLARFDALVALDLSRSGLVGTLPPTGLAGLTALRTLQLSHTAISGTIPGCFHAV
eukprot:SAG31_NODE_17948_length_652_cov_0.810127_1_plen_62_part_01